MNTHMTHTPKIIGAQHQTAEDKVHISFDLSSSLSDIEKHLEDARRNAANERVEPQKISISVNAGHMSAQASPVMPPLRQTNSFQSSFLAELANEAARKQDADVSEAQALALRSQNIHDSLNSIAGFFTSVIQFANEMMPKISRVYCLDARTSFADLTWQGARVDTRKQDLSATAKIAYVSFGVNFQAPQPVLVTRPWSQLEALKEELKSLNLSVIDQAELDGKRPKQEWLQVHLSPNLPVQLRFQANYDKGYIEMLSRNLLSFGVCSFRLNAEDVTPALLDEFGKVLLGRTDKLPDALRT